jgi:hypothetical protein
MSEPEQKEKEAERQQQLKRKTYALVEEIAGGAPGLKLPENRMFVLSAAADLLWEHDEPRARNLFWDALNTLNLMNRLPNRSGSQSTKSAKPSAKEKEQILNQYFDVFRRRQEFLQRVARRDPLLALDMLRSSRQAPVDPPEWLRDGYPLPDDRLLEQQIATEAAERDPERALQLARDSLAKGFSFQLIGLLYRLNQKDAEGATKFAAEVIAKLRGRNIAADLQGASVAVALLKFSRSSSEEIATQLASPASGRRLNLTDEQRCDLVELITNAALTESANGNLLFDLSAIMPEIKAFAPERLTQLQKKLATFNQTLSPGERYAEKFNSLTQNGTPEEVLKFAGTAPDNDHGWMQQQAVVMAVMRGRADSLREYVNREIEDESRRQTLLDALDSEQINLATDRGDVEALQKLLPNVRRREERARAMIGMAVSLEKKGKHDEAVELLDEAETFIKPDLSSETQTNAVLALVGAYALVEPAKAFVIVERTIDRANDDLAKLLLLDKILSSGMIKKGEIRMQNSVMMPIDFAVFKYGKSVAALANADFDRARAAADRFERNELRLLARLLLAQALLGHDDPAHRINPN